MTKEVTLGPTAAKERADEDKEQAKLRLINIIGDTSDARMPELTVIPRMQVLPLSLEMMWNEAMDPKREPGTLFKIWIDKYLRLMRSVGGQHLIRLSMLAESELAEEEENNKLDSWED